MLLIENKPILLDLNCGAGGASAGYSDSGFFVVGFDKHEQPNYPYALYVTGSSDLLYNLENMRTSQASLEIRSEDNNYEIKVDDIAAIHCRIVNQSEIPMIRNMLNHFRIPYVMEHTSNAKLMNPIMIEGSWVGLHPTAMLPGVKMRRFFESNVTLIPPVRLKYPGTVNDGRYITTSFGSAKKLSTLRNAMGVQWMTCRKKDRGNTEDPGNWQDVINATPPAYTAFIGEQLMGRLKEKGTIK
jgi:DNA (cytosine-5)-methyltransferase 1